jgi:hypothetical protein
MGVNSAYIHVLLYNKDLKEWVKMLACSPIPIRVGAKWIQLSDHA